MPAKRTFLPYTKARAFVRSLRLKNRTAWRAYAKQHSAELDAAGVPRSPEVFYLSPQAKHDRGYGYKAPSDPATAHIGYWVDWHDWLGSAYAPRMNAQFLPLHEFLAFVRKRAPLTADERRPALPWEHGRWFPAGGYRSVLEGAA